MSVEAIVWALNVEAPGLDPIAKFVLVGLANHAGETGDAWPSNATLAKYVGVSARTIITKTHALEQLGFIEPGDQDLVARFPANRRPKVWRLNMPVWGEAISPQRVRGEIETISGVKLSSHKPKDKPKEPTGSTSAPAPVDNSQKLIAEWIDNCPGGRPPGRVVGQVAKEVSVMLDEGLPYDQVRRGLQQWQSKRLHPSALASVVHEVRTANGHAKPAKERVICKVCQRPEVACRKMAKITGDDHAWEALTVVA